MPNYCDNWVRISGDEQVLQMFEAQPFVLELCDLLPQEIQNYADKSNWIEEHWGTRWIAPIGDHHAELRLERKDGFLQACFISAWSPPIPFYNRLAEKYPSVIIEYEYTEWGNCFCGYGIGCPGGEPTHYIFGTREEVRELNKLRQWKVCIWSPHFVDDEQGQLIGM